MGQACAQQEGTRPPARAAPGPFGEDERFGQGGRRQPRGRERAPRGGGRDRGDAAPVPGGAAPRAPPAATCIPARGDPPRQRHRHAPGLPLATAPRAPRRSHLVREPAAAGPAPRSYWAGTAHRADAIG